MRDRHEHLTVGELTALLEPQVRASGERRIAGAAYLAEGCPECWAAVEGVGAVDVTARRLSPIGAALARLISPGSWPTLSAGHFEVAYACRRWPFGFAFLVDEEAALTISEVDTSEEPLSEAVSLGALLAVRHGHAALGAVLARLYAIRAEAHVVRGGRSKARDALARAMSCVSRDDEAVDVGTRARLHEAEARFAKRFPRSGYPALSYRKALELTGGWPIRHLELTVELVSLPGWNPRDGVQRVARALHAARELRTSAPEGLVRAQALYRSARLLATAVGEDLGVLRVPDVVAEVADELEAAGDLFATVADPMTRALRDQCLGELRFLHAPGRAGGPLHRALDTFVKAGASRLAEEARGLLVDLERFEALPCRQVEWVH